LFKDHTMPKALFFSLPSVSVVRTLTPIIEEIAASGYEVIYYNHSKSRPAGTEAASFTFRPYSGSADNYYAEKIDEHTSYFQFGEILMDMAAGLMDFLLAEAEKEKPDLIIHSHLAVWGKLLAKHCGIPAMTLYTTFVLDKDIMLPFFRKINAGKNSSLNSVNEGLGFYRKSQQLYSKLGLKEKPDLWDVYINKGDLNISYILGDFQPRREILGPEYHFAGHPSLLAEPGKPERKFIYVSMGTILNKELAFYKLCLEALSDLDIDCIISAGSMVDITALGPVPDHIKILPFVDQPAVLGESILFLSRGGMASLHEAIRSLTPMIVVPVIPEQQVTAERIEELGIGIRLFAEQLTKEALLEAIQHMLANRDTYIHNMKQLAKKAAPLTPGEYTLQVMDAYFQRQTVVELFIRQAAQTPDRTAVICEDTFLSYRELDERSNQLAHYLLQKGLRAQAVVPVLMKHSVEVLIAMWAIMKAGGAYVPLDAEYPSARITMLLEDMDARLLICSDGMEHGLAVPAGCEALPVNATLQLCSTQPVTAPMPLPLPAHLAYVIYTSGSTGKPKGVMVEHAQIHRYTMDVYTRMNLATCERYAMLGTFAADAGLTAVFAALCYGKSLNIINVKRFSGYDEIADYFERCPADCYKITPSLLNFFMQATEVKKMLPKKVLILGGEPCPGNLAVAVRRQLAESCIMYNHYGPTETTVGVITYRFPEKESAFPKIVPLGRPLPHVNAYILNEEMQPAPQGGTGELYIEGPLVARGYLNNPEKTAQKFLTLNLLGNERRLYATGDVVRELPDGNIEYAGRSDDQLKINGNRIEPKEIESNILSDKTVKQCLVLPWESANATRSLVAYIVAGEGFDQERLVQLLKEQLPPYMIPARWVLLEAFPLTFNNKIDRQALPKPEEAAAVKNSGSAAPAGSVETMLLAIWQRLLGHNSIGSNDDFFGSGGDSLLLMRLGYEITDHFSIPLTVTELFGIHTLTVKTLADYIEQKRKTVPAAASTALPEFDHRKATLAQRNLFVQKKLNPSLAFPNSSLTFKIRGAINLEKLESAFKAVIAAHESLRTAFGFEKNHVYKRVGKEFDFTITPLSVAAAAPDSAIMEWTKPFDFDRYPLIRAFVLTLANAEQYLHIDMPHINSDGESMKTIIADVAACYNKSAGQKERLQFEHFQRRLFEYTHTPQYQEDLHFWKAQFSKPVPLLWEKPATGTNPAAPFAGNSYVCAFPEPICGQLKAYLKSSNLSRYQLLLIAYCLFIHRITTAENFAVMLPVHNRGERGLEDVVGLLSNMILLKVEITPAARMGDFTAGSRAVILKSMQHQRFPFEDLAELLKKERIDIRGLMQVFFGYHLHTTDYHLNGASLQLYIPLKDKENLPLSVAVFDTGSGITMRWSSAAGMFDKNALKGLMDQYLDTLCRFMTAGADTTVGSFLV